jgi:hypothetical protein
MIWQARHWLSHTKCDVWLQSSKSPAHVYRSSVRKATNEESVGPVGSSLLPPLRSAQDRRVVHFVLAVRALCLCLCMSPKILWHCQKYFVIAGLEQD